MNELKSPFMTMRLFISFLLLGALGCAESKDAKSGPTAFRDVDVAEFAQLATRSNYVILDVRTPAEFAASRLAGAINLDWRADDFAEKAAKLDKSTTYLVHCATGRRSVSACVKLSDMGFSSLYNLKPGIKGWEADGKPVVR
jgi:rhodanese-related sulfurtransferase